MSYTKILCSILLISVTSIVAITSYNNTWKTVIIEWGYETNPIDKWRPVILIGSALGVWEEIFREAFSKVTPKPNSSQVHINKQILLNALGPYGITNNRLDEVSNYYRYQPQGGNLWKHTKAKVKAIITENEVTGFEILKAGNGYTVAPTITVPGYSISTEVILQFSQNFQTNGSIKEIKILQ